MSSCAGWSSTLYRMVRTRAFVSGRLDLCSMCARLGRPALLTLGVVGGVMIGGCDDEMPRSTWGARSTVPTDTEEALAPDDTVQSGYREADFVESDANRDPFRDFVRNARGGTRRSPQRTVLLPETPVGDLKLTAIVSGALRARAMLVDKSGVGHVALRGDYVGESETLSFGGDSLPIVVNWRVDRIRGDHVVLSRSDPSAPGRPPLTRVIALHPEE